MKIFKIFLLMILFINIANANTDLKDKNLNNKILKNIRCLVCQGQSVYDSESEFSSTIKLLVKKKINDGKSEKQIYEFLLFNNIHVKYVLFCCKIYYIHC